MIEDISRNRTQDCRLRMESSEELGDEEVKNVALGYRREMREEQQWIC